MLRSLVFGFLFLLLPFAFGWNLSENNCSSFKTCTECSSANNTNCLWCSKQSTCYTFDSPNVFHNCSGLCYGSSCECEAPCTDSIFPCSHNIVGLLILIAFYGVLLGYGAKTISDGSELLLELFPKWGSVIGALLLPVLGAVPDAAIILVSGAFGNDPQTQVAVGVGTLAGSTIMLLTVPWFGAMILGRCDVNDVGETIDGKCTGFSLTKQAITVDFDTPNNAKIMIMTSLAYFIVQGVAFAHLHDDQGEAAKKLEKPFALTGFIVCSILLIAYCIYQLFVPQLVERRIKKFEEELELKKERLRALHIVQQMKKKQIVVPDVETPSEAMTEEHKQAKALNVGLKWKKKAMNKQVNEEKENLLADTSTTLSIKAASIQDDEEEKKEEEEEDPRTHFRKNLFKAFALMLVGTAVVAFFSDPMVDAITDFANQIKIKPFYVSFLITPYCSNASELISSLIFASAKKTENTSLTYSQLYGAATMNNTLCLGLFFALIYFRNLAWAFTAETLSILLVTLIVGVLSAFRTKFPVWMALPVISLYPLSLVFVYVLENQAHWA